MNKEPPIRQRIMILALSGIMAISAATVLYGLSNRFHIGASSGTIQSELISILQLAGSLAIGIVLAKYFWRDSNRLAKRMGDGKWIILGETVIWIFIVIYVWVMITGGYVHKVFDRIIQLMEGLL